MKNQKTIKALNFKKITITNSTIMGGLPIQSNVTVRTCEPRTKDTICYCGR